MSEIPIQRLSINSEVLNEHHDQVVFENIPDQYAKGEDVTTHFTILQETPIDSNEDQIGLLRVGSTNIHECLAYAPVQFDSSTRHGTATFSLSILPTTDDEFYQFCYILKKRKCLGSSIPFQLNCSIVDIDLLSQALSEQTHFKPSNDALIAFNDQDNDDLLVIHTKNMLVEEKLRQENRHLLEINQRLEQQKNQCKAKLESLNVKSTEYITKVQSEMQTLTKTHKATIEELATRQRLEAKLRTEYDACRSLCNQYQSESLQFAERCRTLEDTNNQLSNETNRLRSQLSVTKQFTDEQNLQILDLQKHLTESNDALKTAHQYQLQLEQQFRDLRLTSEKYQMSVQGQLDAYIKQTSQQENQLHALESANHLLKDELNSMKNDNTFLVAMTKQDKQTVKDLQQQIDEVNKSRRFENAETYTQLGLLQQELEEAKSNHSSYTQLKNSFNEIEKRCVKHQKSEIEVKKQLTVYKEFINDLQRKIHELTDRLSVGADEYKTLYRKHAALERLITKADHPTTTLSNETGLNEEALVTLLRNSYELQQQESQDEEEEKKIPKIESEEIRECPMCYWEFPEHLTLETKKEHIENHFA